MTLDEAAYAVTIADLTPAWMGPSIRPFGAVTSATEMQSLAHHEAGHAVIALSLGIRVFHASTLPRYDCGGEVRLAPLSGMTIDKGLLVTLAGPAAQRRYFPLLRQFDADLDDHMGRFDTEQARTLLSVLHGADHVSSDLITGELSRWRVRADQAVTLQWPWIAAVATALEQRRRLSGDDIAHLNPSAHGQHTRGRREASA